MKLHVELFGQDFAIELSVSLKVVEVSDQIGKNEHEETFKAEESNGNCIQSFHTLGIF